MCRSNWTLKFVTIVLLLCSCLGQLNDPFLEEVIIISHNQYDVIAFEQFFDLTRAEFIQFEYNDNLVLSDKLIVNYTNEYIIVFDNVKSQIYCFSEHGLLVNKIGSKGGAPNEYINVMGIQIDTIENTVDILCNGGLTVKTFDLDGGFKRSFNTPVSASSFAKINHNRYWLYSGFSGSDNHYRLHLADSTGLVLHSYLHLKTKAIDITEQNFYSKGSNGIFRESFFPTIYRIDSLECKELLRFDFGDKAITERDFGRVKDPFLFIDKIQRRGFLSAALALEGDTTLYIRVVQQSSRDIELFDYFINSYNNSIIKVVNTNPILSEVFYSIKLIHIDDTNGRFYFLTSPFAIEGLAEYFITPNKLNNAFNPKGNPLLIILQRFTNSD